MKDLHFLPISALKGDNLIEKSPNMPWYEGSTLMHLLENVHIAAARARSGTADARVAGGRVCSADRQNAQATWCDWRLSPTPVHLLLYV